MELKTEIQQCLQAFAGADLRTAAVSLLNTLGYQSEKTLDLDGSPEAFLEQFDNNPDRAFRKEKACFIGLDYLALNDLASYFEKNVETVTFGADAEGAILSPERYRIRQAVEAHGVPLEKWDKKLIKRQDKGDRWSNLRNCAYIDAFCKPKIIYPNMTKYLPFYYDSKNHFFINDKAFIIGSDSESLPYLTAVLNSSLFRCCFRDNFPELLGSTYEVRKVFVDKIPIKRSDATTVTLFETLVDYIQFVKDDTNQSTSDGASAAVIAAFLEELIDACVMEVYFAEHMRERKLNLMEHVRSLLPADLDQLSDTEKGHAITSFFEQANATKHPIRNRLTRIISDSPELLAVIKKEGKV